MANIGIGLELLIVGMTTVFIILLIVIWGGKLLIKVVNKIAPEKTVPTKKSAKPDAGAIDSTTIGILDKVVAQITNGTGKISSVKKL